MNRPSRPSVRVIARTARTAIAALLAGGVLPLVLSACLPELGAGPFSAKAAQSAPVAQSAQPGAAPAGTPANENSELILRSLGLLGIDYKWGGNTPAEGMDCSGFVRHVFRDALGLTLPRRSEEMSAYGEAVPREQLQPGDLVFFNTMGRPYSHVGLYIGNQQFVHAPSTGNVIRVESIRSTYWARRFDVAKRIDAAQSARGQDLGALDRLVQQRSSGAPALSAPSQPAPSQPAPSQPAPFHAVHFQSGPVLPVAARAAVPKQMQAVRRPASAAVVQSRQDHQDRQGRRTVLASASSASVPAVSTFGYGTAAGRVWTYSNH